MGVADLFRRNAVNDPFGGEDGFDGESRFAGQGPKIAMIASGALFLLLVGGVAAVVLTGDEAAVTQTVGGSFADLEVVDEPAAPAAGAPAATAPVVADSTAATDRSVERRPWLAAAAPAPAASNAPRPGMEAKPSAPPAKPTTPAVAAAPPPPAKVAAVTPPPPAKPAEVKPADVKPAEVKAAEAKPADAAHAPPAKPAENKVAVMTPPPPASAPAAPAAPAKAVAATDHAPVTQPLQPVSLPKAETTAMIAKVGPEPEPELDPARDIAGIPALRQADEAPGAPRRFDAPAGEGAGVAGGRPRLVEPPLPPTDKIAVAAPPPRYANLTDVKADVNKAAPSASASKIAFIVEGLGLSASATDAAINKLPAGVTLAFSPYARDLKNWIEKAKAKGHEVLIEVPMEGKEFPAEDPGPLGLLTSLEAKDNTERLDAIIKQSNGAVGVLDTMGSKFRESVDHINPVFAKLKASNMFYVQATPGTRFGEATVPTALADVVIDERPFRAAIDARLDYTERLAKYQGSVVASLSAKPVSFERLVLWLQQAEKKGVTLAPVSQVLIK